MIDPNSSARPPLVFRLRAWLGHPWADRVVLAIIVALSLISIDTGLGADDHIHQVILRGADALPSLERDALDLFTFAPGDPEQNFRMMRRGILPWWTDPHAKLAFFRPITSATHWLDQLLWPGTPWLMHAQSLVWFWIGILGVRSLYRRVMGPGWLSTLALLLYGVDDARGAPIAWIANRNALVAAAFAIWAVVCHVRWRQTGWRPGAIVAPLLLLFGLLGGEAAVGMAAYLLAFAITVDPAKGWGRRLSTLGGPIAVIVGWRVVYRLLGYGATGSGIYVDPLGEPARFVAKLLERALPLSLSQLAMPWSEWWLAYPIVFPAMKWVVGALAIAVLGATVVFVRPLWRRDPTVRFWAAGAILSLIPLGTTFPSDRMLLFVAVGAFALVAHLFAEALARWESEAATLPWRALPYAIVGVHLVVAPLTYPLRARGIVAVRQSLELAYRSVPKDPRLSEQTLILVNPPADPYAAYVPIMRAAFGDPVPEQQLWLATGDSAVTVERVDDRTLRVTPEKGFLRTYSEWMLRSPTHPFHVGDEIEVGAACIDITRVTSDGRPAETLTHFDRPLDSPSLRWMVWRKSGYVPFEPPPVGKSVVIEPVDLLAVGLGG